MLTSVQCNANSLALIFKDDATFAYAQAVWEWVNGADNHSFLMVAGVGDCGNNTQRIPFVVNTIAYDEAANLATLSATQSNWTAVAHTYDLTVGQITQPPSQSTTLQTRDIDKTSSIDFTHRFPFSFAISANGLEAKLACTNCSSTGSFDMQLYISTKLFVPTDAKLKLAPRGVSAIGQVKLSGSGSITDALTKEFDILSIPLDGIKIPEILELGPFLTVSVGAEISAISLSASVQAGATARLDDAAILEVDLLNPEANTFSGWEPTIDAVDVRVDASISGGVAVFLKTSVELKAEALGEPLFPTLICGMRTAKLTFL
ncbi:hypothetical protein K491DRAFT_697628 [Lophiostoma macrostomum CBS 122681]|uniref:Uncharacterized protein n=1 Tax=Lophiostoma macrostomum CBS 122681 TaxID=1314788 RepID=A0A6A6SQD5_9PLEO|nr:hypothetical protein K491DRAFT_697628 [Lophiostoma macrostomum CBS 122681]